MMTELDPEILAALRAGRLLSATFTERNRIEGNRYAVAGAVRDIKIRGGRVIEAETQGSQKKPYWQLISFPHDRKGNLRVDGTCSCPVDHNCKHIAAVLSAVLMPRRAAPATAPVAAPAAVIRAAPAAPPPEPGPPPLPSDIAHWLAGLAEIEESPEALARIRRTQLRFVLQLGPYATKGLRALIVAPRILTLRKDGTLGQERPFAYTALNNPARYLGSTERLLLRRLALLQHQHAGLATDDDPPGLLRALIATGRTHWQSADGPLLTEAPPRPAPLQWSLDDRGAQRPVLAIEPPLIPLNLGAPWCLDPDSASLAPLDTGLPGAVALRLIQAPPIPPEHLERVAEALAQRAPAAPRPATLAPPEPLAVPPIPCLRLTEASLPFDPYDTRPRRSWYEAREIRLPIAQLAFAYGPAILPPAANPTAQTVAAAGQLYRITRDRDAERGAMLRLDELGLVDAQALIPIHLSPIRPGTYILDPQAPEADWMEIAIEGIAALRAEGWRIETAADFPIRIVAADDDAGFDARIAEGSGIDWFDLDLGIMLEGKRLNLVPLLLKMIREAEGASLVEHHDDDEPFLIPLDDGRLLTLPMARIRPIIEALADFHAAGGGEDGPLRVSRNDAAALDAFARATGLDWQGGEQLRALGRLLNEPLAVPSLPPQFTGTLRPYQAQGVAWLQRLRATQFGGILADDMGLGKTVQTLAHLAIEHAEGRLDQPALILCPTSLIPNWSREAARFAPHLKLLTLHGTDRKALFDQIPASNLVLTTYPLLARDHEVLTEQEWSIAILDEAQIIKNPKAETTRAAMRIKASQRLCLSGTPFQNHLGELWSLFDYLSPGFLGSERTFRSRYRTPIEKHGSAERQALLQRRIRPFLLRRTKAEVATDLPPRTDILEPVEMEAPQRALYEGIRIAMHAKVQGAIAERGLARSGIIILDALLKLRQACCDPRLVKLPSAKKTAAASAKLDRLMELTATLIDEGRRILIFSQFTSMLALIEERLATDKLPYVILTGDTKDRATPVQRFQAGEVPIFLVSLKAGGVGLNLTAADTVIHYDPWWNPAAEDQATDRAHRIGQNKPVFVHRLMTLGSIEEKIETLKAKKRGLVASILDTEKTGALSLTEADIAELFAPA